MWFSGSLLLIGLMCGTLSGGCLSDWLSARWCIALTSPLTLLGWAAIASGAVTDGSIWPFYLGRLMTGLGTGAQIPVVMTYLCALPARSSARRARLASLGPLTACAGIVASYLTGLSLPWRAAAVAGGVFPSVAMAATPLMRADDKAVASAHVDSCGCGSCLKSDADSLSDSKELIINNKDNNDSIVGYFGNAFLTFVTSKKSFANISCA